MTLPHEVRPSMPNFPRKNLPFLGDDRHLELTDSDLAQLTQQIPLKFTMAESRSALMNLHNLSDDDLKNLQDKIVEEQDRRKWQRIHKILDQYLFCLSVDDLKRVVEEISAKIEERQGEPMAIFSEAYDRMDSPKDSLTGQYTSEESWQKSGGQGESKTIDVEVAPSED